MQPCNYRTKTLTFGKFKCSNPEVKLNQVTYRDCNRCVMQDTVVSIGGNLKKEIRLEALNVAPGDILMLTAAVKALHKAHPNKYLVEVSTVTQEIWDHNPLVVPPGTLSDPQIITMNYTEAINRSSNAPYHFIHGYVQDLAIPFKAIHHPKSRFNVVHRCHNGHAKATHDRFHRCLFVERFTVFGRQDVRVSVNFHPRILP